jgi:uroporphyrinogen-III decarboxylase
MNSQERVLAALNGAPVDQVATGPLAVHFCARQAGVTIQEYTMDAGVLSDCVIRYYEKYRPDAIWLSA